MFLWAFSCLPLRCLARSLHLFGRIDALHNAAMSVPHWYLWALGVEPGMQRRGIGGAIIRPVLDRADQGGLPCYLETANDRNLPFYQRHGFEVGGEHRAHSDGMTIWTMIRPAARRP